MRPVRRADNLTTFMCRLSWYLGASTSWNTYGLSRPVMGLLFLYLYVVTSSCIVIARHDQRSVTSPLLECCCIPILLCDKVVIDFDLESPFLFYSFFLLTLSFFPLFLFMHYFLMNLSVAEMIERRITGCLLFNVSKGNGRYGSWTILKHYLGICLGRLRKTTLTF